jgi:hypothetical protein
MNMATDSAYAMLVNGQNDGPVVENAEGEETSLHSMILY